MHAPKFVVYGKVLVERGLTNKEVESYTRAVGQFANDWRALQWQPYSVGALDMCPFWVVCG